MKGRLEDRRLLTGQGRFISDWNFPNQAHAALVRAARAEERRVGLIRKIPVGDESPLPGEQAPVFQSSLHGGVENTRTAGGSRLEKRAHLRGLGLCGRCDRALLSIAVD